MKKSTPWIIILLVILFGGALFFRARPKPSVLLAPASRADIPNTAVSKHSEQSQNNTQPVFTPKGMKPEIRFAVWIKQMQMPVQFLNPPKVDAEGLFCVMNPEYQLDGMKVIEVVEDGYWYHHAVTGAGRTILFGKGNGRPPWAHKVGDLSIENGELKLRHRISFGGNNGVRTRLLLDLNENSSVTKIGAAFDEMVPGSPWGYPTVVADEMVISPEEVEHLPLTNLKPNWMQMDTDFMAVETFHEPVRVIWFQFQEEGKRIVRIDN